MGLRESLKRNWEGFSYNLENSEAAGRASEGVEMISEGAGKASGGALLAPPTALVGARVGWEAWSLVSLIWRS